MDKIAVALSSTGAIQLSAVWFAVLLELSLRHSGIVKPRRDRMPASTKPTGIAIPGELSAIAAVQQ